MFCRKNGGKNMATYYEQTIVCTLCNAAKRITKTEDHDWNFGEWEIYSKIGQVDKYMCPNCKNAIKGLFNQFMTEWEKSNKKEPVKPRGRPPKAKKENK